MAAVPDLAMDDGRAGMSRRQRRRTAARVAAVAFSLVLVGGTVVTLQELGILPGLAVADAGTGTSPPHFVTIDGEDDIQVQATATGKVTYRVAPPSVLADKELNRSAVLAVAAKSGQFAVAYGAQGEPIRLYTFGLTRIGRVTGLSQIPGGVVSDLMGYRLAISPDGAKVAISGSPERP